MMNKKQTFEILTLIQNFYEQFDINQNKIDAWHLVLKNFDLDKVKDNLLQYCRSSIYPPKVADLIKDKPKILDRMNAIPGVEETRFYLNSFPNPEEFTDEQKQSIEQSKAKIRQILGIG
jgi:hypothetical protein